MGSTNIGEVYEYMPPAAFLSDDNAPVGPGRATQVGRWCTVDGLDQSTRHIRSVVAIQSPHLLVMLDATTESHDTMSSDGACIAMGQACHVYHHLPAGHGDDECRTIPRIVRPQWSSTHRPLMMMNGRWFIIPAYGSDKQKNPQYSCMAIIATDHIIPAATTGRQPRSTLSLVPQVSWRWYPCVPADGSELTIMSHDDNACAIVALTWWR